MFVLLPCYYVIIKRLKSLEKPPKCDICHVAISRTEHINLFIPVGGGTLLELNPVKGEASALGSNASCPLKIFGFYKNLIGLSFSVVRLFIHNIPYTP